MTRKRPLPKFLADKKVSPETYERWLDRKAKAHVKRDRKRGITCSAAAYRDAIHIAVQASNGRDAYTGEELQWELISTYRNDESRLGRHDYKAGFALLPTVDHVTAGASTASFKICGWRTNDAKNDLSFDVLVTLCERVLRHAGYTVHKPEGGGAPRASKGSSG